MKGTLNVHSTVHWNSFCHERAHIEVKTFKFERAALAFDFKGWLFFGTLCSIDFLWYFSSPLALSKEKLIECVPQETVYFVSLVPRRFVCFFNTVRDIEVSYIIQL